MTFHASSAQPVAALTFLAIASCAAQGVAPEPRATVEPNDLYPLRVGHAWSYDVDTGEPTTTLAITRVEAFDGRIATVRNANALVRYEVEPDGIRLASSDAWLVRAPLEEGATWPAPGGRTAELVSRTAEVRTPAGEFQGCFEVLETGGKLELEVRTVYCPGVGPVLVASTMRSETSDRALTVSARLRGYDVTSPTASDG